MSKFFSKKKTIAGIILLLIPMAVLLTVYTYKAVSSSDEIVITDADLEPGKGGKELTITDQDFIDFKEQIRTAKKNSQQVKILGDNSELTTMYDGYGNIAIIRSFNNHSRLKKIVMRVSSQGESQIFVYGQNGKVENLSQNMVSKALNSSADELANLAKIYETREEIDRKKEELARRKEEQLKPLPSEEFPVYNPNAEFPDAAVNPPVQDKTETFEPEAPQQYNPQNEQQDERNEELK